jgi:hypothetical protein
MKKHEYSVQIPLIFICRRHINFLSVILPCWTRTVSVASDRISSNYKGSIIPVDYTLALFYFGRLGDHIVFSVQYKSTCSNYDFPRLGATCFASGTNSSTPNIFPSSLSLYMVLLQPVQSRSLLLLFLELLRSSEILLESVRSWLNKYRKGVKFWLAIRSKGGSFT